MKEPIDTGVIPLDNLTVFFRKIHEDSMQESFDIVLNRHLSKPNTHHPSQSKRTYEKGTSKHKTNRFR